MAGGMLAPWCERASTDAAVLTLGEPSIDWWGRRFAGTVRNGSLVVAPPRDTAELSRFAGRTERFDWLDGTQIADLEPDLAGRFRRALFFPDEAHLDPRRALPALADLLKERSVPIHFGVDAPARGRVVDCRGLAARDALPDLRGVRGEMVVVRSRDLSLSRPVRLLHPRIPLYIVPRGGGVFMIGATMVESEERDGASVRSTVELLNAAYAVHPAFGEAEILELGADLRPAFPDNLPAVRRGPRGLLVNGLYRHGFLLAPAMARQAADLVEMDNADLRQRRSA
jgi:glycine oxidase